MDRKREDERIQAPPVDPQLEPIVMRLFAAAAERDAHNAVSPESKREPTLEMDAGEIRGARRHLARGPQRNAPIAWFRAARLGVAALGGACLAGLVLWHILPDGRARPDGRLPDVTPRDMRLVAPIYVRQLPQQSPTGVRRRVASAAPGLPSQSRRDRATRRHVMQHRHPVPNYRVPIPTSEPTPRQAPADSGFDRGTHDLIEDLR